MHTYSHNDSLVIKGEIRGYEFQPGTQLELDGLSASQIHKLTSNLPLAVDCKRQGLTVKKNKGSTGPKISWRNDSDGGSPNVDYVLLGDGTYYWIYLSSFEIATGLAEKKCQKCLINGCL